MAPKPTGWNRIVAKLQGEVPAAELEAFRRASGPVFELLEQVERRRLECRIDGLDPWTVPPATRMAFRCAWNAFVLQTLGNEYLDADYRAEPRTPHFVPPATAAQVLRFYEPVEAWVNRAWQAQANPEYRLDAAVPAAPPAWVPATPLPPAHLDGLLRAVRAVRDHADAAMGFLPATPPEDDTRQAQLNHLRQLYASAQARARYAEDLCGSDPVPEVRERAGEHARSAIELFYLLGQLAADPELAAHAEPRAAEPGPTRASRASRSLSAPRQAAPEAKVAAEAKAAQATKAAVPPASAPTPPRSAGRKGRTAEKAPRLHLATRHDRFKSRTITATAESVGFMGDFSGETHFSLKLAYVRAADSRWVVLDASIRSYGMPTSLSVGTLTVHADGQNTVLRPMPDHKINTLDEDGTISFHEHLGYALPDGLLEKLSFAKRAGLLFENLRGAVEVDDAVTARFQAYCRGFYELVVQPVEG